MKKLISDLHNAVQNSRKTIEFLKENSSRNWFDNYPIAIVNEIIRIKDKESLEALQKISFFNEQGFSKNNYTQKEIDYLNTNVPSAIKSAYCLCLNQPQDKVYTFNPKFEHDKWKKVKDKNNFLALVESSKFLDNHTSQDIETELRDIMRSRKEIPSLKAIGFVWIVTLPTTTKITDILEHYFLDDYIYVQKGRKITYIAWSDKLADINMRYFVNNP